MHVCTYVYVQLLTVQSTFNKIGPDATINCAPGGIPPPGPAPGRSTFIDARGACGNGPLEVAPGGACELTLINRALDVNIELIY